jgi:putative molybdopterin biosynthesis protein
VGREARARSRLVPHIEALRAELERVLADALDGSQQVLTVLPATTWRCRCCATWPRPRRLHIDLKFAGSMDALRRAGRRPLRGGRLPRAAAGRQPQRSRAA